MSDNKQEMIKAEGEVIETLPNAFFRVKLDNGHEILAYLSGKMKMFHIKILPGDRVSIEMTPYDLTKGRITYRQKPGSRPQEIIPVDTSSDEIDETEEESPKNG